MTWPKDAVGENLNSNGIPLALHTKRADVGHSQRVANDGSKFRPKTRRLEGGDSFPLILFDPSGLPKDPLSLPNSTLCLTKNRSRFCWSLLRGREY